MICATHHVIPNHGAPNHARATQVASEHRTAHYAEASMLDGYGLSFLYMYLALPFLRLQRETLLRQLEINDTAAADLKHELTLRQLGVKHTYEAYVPWFF
jgi:hypothetical protein